MERLTTREARVSGLPGVCCTHFTQPECQTLGGCCTEGCPWEDAVWESLADYEDTGLAPEEVERLKEYMQPFTIQDMDRFREIMQAEKEGRLVVLPCRVTDTMYITEAVFENGKQKRRNKPSGEQVVSAQIDHVTIGGTGKPVFDLCTETGNWYCSMNPEQFYLTREAAEAVPKGRER